MAIIKIRGSLVDIICEIYSDYKAYVTREKRGINQLLIRCLNYLHEPMATCLLYYRNFTKSLTCIGFEINPYDPCVTNKLINGSQVIILFHVDEFKLSHRDLNANDFIIKFILQEYESIFDYGSGNMSVRRGKVHEYP